MQRAWPFNPRFGNNPRWFWETVALYENGEFVNPANLDYIVRGMFPTLQQLNVDPNGGTQIYRARLRVRRVHHLALGTRRVPDA